MVSLLPLKQWKNRRPRGWCQSKSLWHRSYLKNNANIVVHEADARARVYGIALTLKTMPTSSSTRLMPIFSVCEEPSSVFAFPFPFSFFSSFSSLDSLILITHAKIHVKKHSLRSWGKHEIFFVNRFNQQLNFEVKKKGYNEVGGLRGGGHTVWHRKNRWRGGGGGVSTGTQWRIH